jgi:hypothetical protein
VKTSLTHFFLTVLAVVGYGSIATAAVNVPEHHNHDSRDGLYIDPAFTPALAANLKRDPAFSGVIAGMVYAQPLYIEGAPGGKALVIAVTESNTVYALDAVNGTVIWQTNVAVPTPSGVLPCGDITPLGITGTPIVNLATRTLYFDAMTGTTQATARHQIFALNVDTGSVLSGWPVDVNSTAKFNGIFFTSLTQNQRGALAMVGPNVYVPYSGLDGDCGTYYGWVVGVNMNNPTNVMAWATTAHGGGIWGVNGVSSDGTTPFAATGNTFNASTWGGGEAIVRLQQNLSLTNGTTNYWTPTNWSSLDGSDSDLGSSGAMLVDVPGATPSQLVAAFGKDGNVYLLNRNNLGGISAPLAQAHVYSSVIIQAPVTYTTSKGTYMVFDGGSSLTALRITPTSPPTIITNVWTESQGGRASPFVTSTDGSNNVIVWGYGAESGQRLLGFDGDTGATVYAGGGTNELLAGTHRFSTAIAARGHIYVATDNKVYSFIVPNQPVTTISLSNLNVLPTGSFQFSFENVSGGSFSVYASTNLAAAVSTWPKLGSPTEIAPGQYQFTDQPQTQARFYRVTSP